MIRPSGRIQRVSKPNSRELESIYRIKCPLSSRLQCRSEVLRSYRANFSKPYNALALDYDGTLLSLSNRTGRLSRSIINSIGNFLNGEIPIVVISGRGESLLRLRPQLAKFRLDRLFLAMYNGAEIVNAENGLVVKKERNSASSLNPAFELLAENSDVTSTKTKIVQKPHSIQIQVRERSTSRLDELCRIVSTILPHRFAVRSSGYAIDIYPRGKMKDYCLRLINEHFGVRLNFIKVGDQGHKLGNDFELLSKRGGFSVGTLSTDETSCFPVVDEWGNRLLGVKGCIHLLSHTFRLL